MSPFLRVLRASVVNPLRRQGLVAGPPCPLPESHSASDSNSKMPRSGGRGSEIDSGARFMQSGGWRLRMAGMLTRRADAPRMRCRLGRRGLDPPRPKCYTIWHHQGWFRGYPFVSVAGVELWMPRMHGIYIGHLLPFVNGKYGCRLFFFDPTASQYGKKSISVC